MQGEPSSWQDGDPRIIEIIVSHAQNVYALVHEEPSHDLNSRWAAGLGGPSRHIN